VPAILKVNLPDTPDRIGEVSLSEIRRLTGDELRLLLLLRLHLRKGETITVGALPSFGRDRWSPWEIVSVAERLRDHGGLVRVSVGAYRNVHDTQIANAAQITLLKPLPSEAK
jgi:hypothetical protein